VVDRAGLLHLIGNELVALVEKQDAELLPLGECHGGAAIVEHTRARRQHRPFLHLSAGEPAGRRVHDLQFGDHRLADALDLAKPA